MKKFTFTEIELDPILRFLEPNPNLPANLIVLSDACADLAREMIDNIPRSAERTAGLRKLLEAKDCFVGAAL